MKILMKERDMLDNFDLDCFKKRLLKCRMPVFRQAGGGFWFIYITLVVTLLSLANIGISLEHVLRAMCFTHAWQHLSQGWLLFGVHICYI